MEQAIQVQPAQTQTQAVQMPTLPDMESKTAEEVLKWAVDTYGKKVALSCSFSPEDVVIVDLLAKITKKPVVFTLDTGRLNPETYDVMDAVRQKYNIKIKVMFPKTPKVEKMVRAKGLNLFYDSIENRKMCCQIRKIEPLNRALKGMSGWMTGLRRQQSITRTDMKKVEWDSVRNMVKINPLMDWTSQQVWDYIKKNNVPYNKLFDLGYASIGCAPCTRAIKPGEDERAGRWWWENPETKECGLHADPATLAKAAAGQQPTQAAHA
ncbi:MAG: phosphoadenylyl-sulfate reductase [DPANN group archaeon]|nr:phosphoadenylyl-sulfate reductase [DPANN group archaeon]